MKVKMLRTLGVKAGEQPARVEGETYDVKADEGAALVGAGLAEDVSGEPKKAAPPKEAK